MLVAVEGMDGVGKTEIAKYISEKYNFRFIEKPLHYFYNDDYKDNYDDLMKAARKVYDFDDIVKAWYFSLGNIYCARMLKDENIVIDRHFVSNYYWNGNNSTNLIFKNMIEICGKPDLTILLYATPSTRMKRLKKRNENDHDLLDPEKKDDGNDKMVYFLEEFSLPYELINTENLSLDEVKSEIDKLMKDLLKNKSLVKKV